MLWLTWVLVFFGAVLAGEGIAPRIGVCLWASGIALQFVIGGIFLYKRLALKQV